jgi:DNA-binding CsgD family transcriptional regulator
MNIKIREQIEGFFEELSNNASSQNFNQEAIEKHDLKFGAAQAIGRYFPFVIDIPAMKYLYVGINAENVIGYSRNDIMQFRAGVLASKLLKPEHGMIAAGLMGNCIQTLKKNYLGRTDVEVNVDCIAYKKNGDPMRLLFQFKPLEWSDSRELLLVGGCFVDISYLKRDGPPVVTINMKGELLHSFEYEQGNLHDTDVTVFTPKEMEILRLISSGATTDEIANTIGVSKATVYTHKRNIMAKSEFSSVEKEIKSLKSKGLLD